MSGLPGARNRWPHLVVTVVVCGIVLAACGPAGPGDGAPSTGGAVHGTTSTTTTTTPVPTTLPAPWTEPELLSQLIMVGASFADPGASAPVVRDGAGGLVFLGQPAAGTRSTITSGLGALELAGTTPPFLATDEEGGGIARLSNVVGPLPWPRQMVAQWSPAEVTGQLTTIGTAMGALGLNMDLAPVLDTASSTSTVDDEDLRSFSQRGSTAATYGVAFLRGLSAGGIVGVAKHFPGLGHADADTDLGPATDPPLADLAGDDLVPFREAIAAGVRVVMMSNVIEPDWGTAPASLTRAAYAYVRTMGFTGVILTDSLDARSITAAGVDGARAVVEAIEAGADMAMITTPSEYPAALAGLEAAVSTGALSMAEVLRSVDRIVAVKHAVLPAAQAIAPPVLSASEPPGGGADSRGAVSE